MLNVVRLDLQPFHGARRRIEHVRSQQQLRGAHAVTLRGLDVAVRLRVLVISGYEVTGSDGSVEKKSRLRAVGVMPVIVHALERDVVMQAGLHRAWDCDPRDGLSDQPDRHGGRPLRV
jgi:hypothetical protein